MACTTPPSGILPFHTVISFIVKKCDVNLKEILIIKLLPDITQICYQMRLASFKPNFTPLTYSPVILLSGGFVPRKKILRMTVRAIHTFIKIGIQDL